MERTAGIAVYSIWNMTERYAIHSNLNQLVARFGIEEAPGYTPCYNASPGKLLPVITHQSPQGFSFFYWGTAPAWIKNKTLAERIINTRVEWIQEKPLLRKALMRYRCLIPANGFYAWKKIGKKSLVPHLFTPQQALISFAGIWEEYDDQDGNSFHTFSVLTMPATAPVLSVTDRMPVIFNREQELIWLNPHATELQLLALIKPLDENALTSHVVSPAVFSPDVDKPSLLLPAPPADQFGNLTLFD
ncbi:MAG: SOS response-associated peptidase [Cyclobacteriaceae bacterium]|nr:SOS response-associated peptidase [Cyclobacteriaceae bacterium]